MEPYVAELIGVAVAAASLYSAHAKTMVPLRVAAIVGNILAMAVSFMLGTYPIFMLNTALLALHGWRLRAMLNLIRDIDVAAGSGMNVDWLLPYTRPKHFKADDIMMERGEYATAAFYIVSGEVEIVEIKETFGKGTLLGEIGLFTPDGSSLAWRSTSRPCAPGPCPRRGWATAGRRATTHWAFADCPNSAQSLTVTSVVPQVQF